MPATDTAPRDRTDIGKRAAASAVAALGLVSTWTAEPACASNAVNTVTINASLTYIGTRLTDTVVFFTDTATATLDTVAATAGDVHSGRSTGIRVASPGAGAIGANSTYSFAAAIDNGDGSSDIVLAFKGDGSVADGALWSSLFEDGLPGIEQVFESSLLEQLADPTGIGQDGAVAPGSQLDRLAVFYGDLLAMSFGEEATLVSFSGPNNTGVIIGTILVVPAPASVALLGLSGLFAGARRRRG